MQGPRWNESGLLLETCSLDAKDSRVCAYSSFTHEDAVNSRDTLERALEPELQLGESASSQQAFPHFSMKQRVNHADFVSGCRCSFCMSIPILENALEVSVTALVFTVCRPPQVSELECARSTME